MGNFMKKIFIMIISIFIIISMFLGCQNTPSTSTTAQTTVVNETTTTSAAAETTTVEQTSATTTEETNKTTQVTTTFQSSIVVQQTTKKEDDNDDIPNIFPDFFPVTQEKINVSCFMKGYTEVRPPVEEIWVWQKLEEMTNLHFDFIEIPGDQLAERRQIMLATNSYPEAMMTHELSPEEVFKYGKQGIFMPVDQYIDT